MSVMTESRERRGPSALWSRRSRGLKARSRWTRALSYLFLSVFAVVYIGPVLMLVVTSLKPLSEFFRNATGLPETYLFSNYSEAWSAAPFPRFVINTAFYAGTATAIMVITSIFVAFPIARGYVKGAGKLYTLYVVALFLPPALIPQFQLWVGLDLYNTVHGYIMLFLINPIAMIILVNYIKSIPRELDESAAVDGCGYGRFVWTVILPLIKPAVATVTVLHAIGIWNELILPTIYVQQQDLYPITRGLIVFAGQYGAQNWPQLAAAVLILMIPMLILFMFLQRYIISGLTSGSVKG